MFRVVIDSMCPVGSVGGGGGGGSSSGIRMAELVELELLSCGSPPANTSSAGGGGGGGGTMDACPSLPPPEGAELVQVPVGAELGGAYFAPIVGGACAHASHGQRCAMRCKAGFLQVGGASSDVPEALLAALGLGAAAAVSSGSGSGPGGMVSGYEGVVLRSCDQCGGAWRGAALRCARIDPGTFCRPSDWGAWGSCCDAAATRARRAARRAARAAAGKDTSEDDDDNGGGGALGDGSSDVEGEACVPGCAGGGTQRRLRYPSALAASVAGCATAGRRAAAGNAAAGGAGGAGGGGFEEWCGGDAVAASRWVAACPSTSLNETRSCAAAACATAEGATPRVYFSLTLGGVVRFPLAASRCCLRVVLSFFLSFFLSRTSTNSLVLCFLPVINLLFGLVPRRWRTLRSTPRRSSRACGQRSRRCCSRGAPPRRGAAGAAAATTTTMA